MAYLTIGLSIILLIIAIALIASFHKKDYPLLKGAIFGGAIGILFWIASIFLQGYFISKIFSPFCGILGNGIEGFGMCLIFFGHIANIITFSLIGAIVGGIIYKIRSN